MVRCSTVWICPSETGSQSIQRYIKPSFISLSFHERSTERPNYIAQAKGGLILFPDTTHSITNETH